MSRRLVNGRHAMVLSWACSVNGAFLFFVIFSLLYRPGPPSAGFVVFFSFSAIGRLVSAFCFVRPWFSVLLGLGSSACKRVSERSVRGGWQGLARVSVFCPPAESTKSTIRVSCFHVHAQFGVSYQPCLHNIELGRWLVGAVVCP